jgi:hypothetical protein
MNPEQEKAIQEFNQAVAVLRQIPDSQLQQPSIYGWQDTAKAFPGAPSMISGHGAGGLFNQPAAERRLFSALSLPRKGLQDALRLVPSNKTDPTCQVITGIGQSSGSEATEVCDDPPTVGDLETCIISNYPFGRFSRQTKVIDVTRLGETQNRGDFRDQIIVGSPFTGGQAMSNMPSIPGGNNYASVAARDVIKELVTFTIAMSRDHAKLLYTGNPANNTSGNGYMQYRGLDILINDSYSNDLTGAACDRVDSLIRSFSDAAIESNQATIVREVVETTNFLQRRAEVMGLDPVEFALVMPYNLFRALVFIWASAYMSYRIDVVGGADNRANFSGETLMNQTLSMLNERYLMVDSGRIRVITDEAIVETVVGGGVYESEIKWVPLTAMGGAVPGTYMEYFDFTGFDAMAGALQIWGGNREDYSWYDDGRFLAHFKPPNNWCIQMAVLSRPRLRLDIPWLAARLTDIRYTPFIPEESSFPGDATYVGGGTPGPLPGAPFTIAEISAASAGSGAGNVVFTLATKLDCTNDDGDVLVIFDDGFTIPAVIDAGNGTTSVTLDFTTARTPVPLQAVDNTTFTWTNAKIQCDDL